MLAVAALSAIVLFARMQQQPPPETPALFEVKDITLAFPSPPAEITEDVLPPPTPQAATMPAPAKPDSGSAPAESAPPKQVPTAHVQPLPSPLALDPTPLLSDQEFYGRFAAAAVQIYCRTSKEIFAASGVMVNARGLVLTNAHVAEIAESAGEKNCQARHGNPAESFAGIEVVFTADTSAKITDTEVPERDFAFLRLVESREPFAFAAIDFAPAREGESFLTLGYPSEFLQGVNAEANANLVFSVLTVAGFSDLDDDRATVEAYVFRGGLALQQGSSGTAIFRRSGGVAGLVFATTKGVTTADRDGVALTVPYMERIMRLETGEGLAEFIASH